jgi:hypothetical protein
LVLVEARARRLAPFHFHLAFLRLEVIGDSVERIKFLFASPEDVKDFAEHCVHIRSVYEYARRLFSESTDAELEAMNSVAPLFFEDLALVFAEFVVLAACRVTDPSKMGRRENLVVELFTSALVRFKALHQQLADLQVNMEKHRRRIEKSPLHSESTRRRLKCNRTTGKGSRGG